MEIKTAKVRNRRNVHYDTMDDLLADAEHLAAADVHMLGNWTLAQVFGHLSTSLDSSIDGFPVGVPWPLKVIARLFMRKMLLDGPLKPGFRLPESAKSKMIPPADTSTQEALERLRNSISRQKSETHRVPHLALGKLSVEDWTRASLRHAELHMSFATLQQSDG